MASAISRQGREKPAAPRTPIKRLNSSGPRENRPCASICHETRSGCVREAPGSVAAFVPVAQAGSSSGVLAESVAAISGVSANSSISANSAGASPDSAARSYSTVGRSPGAATFCVAGSAAISAGAGEARSATSCMTCTGCVAPGAIGIARPTGSAATINTPSTPSAKSNRQQPQVISVPSGAPKPRRRSSRIAPLGGRRWARCATWRRRKSAGPKVLLARPAASAAPNTRAPTGLAQSTRVPSIDQSQAGNRLAA